MIELQPPSEVREGAKSSYDRLGESKGIPVIKPFFVEDYRNGELDRKKGGLPSESAGEEPNRSGLVP